MVATLVIALREGLEAALIVGILAAFFRRNGTPLLPLWVGVGSAAGLSLLVGFALEVLSASLPQQAQEALESVISAIAVVFVTMMIVWMSTHSRGLKSELEAHASEALAKGTVWALALMAFLAVLREGFELSVFLLATFQASVNVTAAVTGAVVGLLAAALVGIAIYRGGVRFNMARFFAVTGVFLVLVAGGLVVTTLRTAHAAGWVNIGQARTVDLAWLAPPGSIRSALLTGVLGIPADPRVIEVLAWLCYVLPMLAVVLWPAAHRPAARAKATFQLGLAATLAILAVGLVLLPSPAGYAGTGSAPLITPSGTGRDSGSVSVGAAATDGSAVPATLLLTSTGAATRTRVDLRGVTWVGETHAGVASLTATWTDTLFPALPTQLTINELLALGRGRLPVGMNSSQHPGPYDASWSATGRGQVWVTADGALLDATHDGAYVLQLSGGGLRTTRTVTVTKVSGLPPPGWITDPQYVARTAAAIKDATSQTQESALWNRWLPFVAAIAAFGLLLAAARTRRNLTPAEPDAANNSVAAPTTRSTHAL